MYNKNLFDNHIVTIFLFRVIKSKKFFNLI